MIIVYETEGMLEVGTIKQGVTDAHNRPLLELYNGDVITPQQVVGRVKRGRRHLSEVYATVNAVNEGREAWIDHGSALATY